MDCPACGAPDPGTGNFCARCGAALRAAPAPVPEPPPTIVVPPIPDQKQQVASHWHTLLVVSLMLLISLSGPSRQKRTVRQGSRPLLYTSAIITEWVMVGVVWIGVRRRGYTIRSLAGRAWRGFDDFLLDIAIAAGTWFGFFVVAAVLAVAMGLMDRLPELRKAIEFMSPKTLGELALFIVLGATAGLCEEIVFRGYLQRQFAALSRSIAIGVLGSAIVFGASHLYEGPERMIIIGVFGAILGTTSALRKSL
ncbi:MAG TPA: CPBP family intramembrane glutamic endopeptidase, partial [Terriglobales bacterium]|nr:CPBP family intramembrane glutamic endopeptidase [Terriglobales bacterium]